MITAHTFFSGTLHTVDTIINQFVYLAYAYLAKENTTLITLLLTIYVMGVGCRFLLHEQPIPLRYLTYHLTVVLCVYGLVMNWQLYHLLIYRVFTTEPEHIARVLSHATSNHQTTDNLIQTLDHLYAFITDTTIHFFGQASLSTAGIAFILYGLLVFVVGIAMCTFALLLFIYAKMMMAVALALGPIFILFILWHTTKNLFTAWLNKLMTLALIPIVTSAILTLMLSVIQITLPTTDSVPLHFYSIVPFLGLSIATTLILSQVLRICSALGGGMSLANLSHGATIVYTSLEKSGMTAVSRKAARWTKEKTTHIHRRLWS
jgi:type IV secretion system protein VirB6